VAGEYDAGVQIGEFIQREMIAVRVTKDMRLAIVGSPEYFKSHKVPRKPQDLKDHACVGFRFSSGLYRWEFEKGRKALTVSPQGPASFDDPDLVIQAGLEWCRIGTAMEGNPQGLDCRRTSTPSAEGLVSDIPRLFSLPILAVAISRLLWRPSLTHCDLRIEDGPFVLVSRKRASRQR